MNDPVKLEIIALKLKGMEKQGWFSICDFNEILEFLDICGNGHPAYQTLRMLHCVHFKKMSPELRDRIPDLIAEVLEIEPIFFRGALGPGYKKRTTVLENDGKGTEVPPSKHDYYSKSSRGPVRNFLIKLLS